MTSAELLALVVEGALAVTVGLLAVLVARRPVRRAAGARVAYGLWALVPVALLAVLVPAPQHGGGPAVLGISLPAVQLHAATAPSDGGWTSLLLAGWAAGLLATALLACLAQRRFVRGLGYVQLRPDGLHQAEHGGGLPAAIGLLRPRILVPPDFDQRYHADERALMRLHEQLHIRSGDLLANAVAVALRCLFWFNPLGHAAWRLFRHDQELACDHRVLMRHPRSRRCYGEAMLKTQLAVLPLPLACNWGYGHPIKERIAMLKQPLPSSRRALAGTVAVCLFVSVTAAAAWAAQPSTGATPGSVDHATRALDQPTYPAAAVEQRIEGRVVLVVDIDAAGQVTDVVVESAEPAGVFDDAAAQAARKWMFNPAVEEGRRVASRVRVPVDFSMDPPDGQGPGAL